MRINEPMSPDELPAAIAAPKKGHRTYALDDEANVAERAGPSDVTRHFAGAHADPIARTLAAVMQPGVRAPRILQGGPV